MRSNRLNELAFLWNVTKSRFGAACYTAILALCLTSYYAAPATRFVKSDSGGAGFRSLIGAGLATGIVALFLHCRTSRALLKRYAWLLAGALTPLISLHWLLRHKASVDRSVRGDVSLQFEYSAVSWRTRLGSLMPGVNALFGLGLAFPVAGAALFALISRFQHQSRRVRWLVVLCIVDLALEMALSSISGRGYLHYFTMWAPASALLCAFPNDTIYVWGYGPEIYVLARRSSPSRFMPGRRSKSAI